MRRLSFRPAATVLRSPPRASRTASDGASDESCGAKGASLRPAHTTVQTVLCTLSRASEATKVSESLSKPSCFGASKAENAGGVNNWGCEQAAESLTSTHVTRLSRGPCRAAHSHTILRSTPSKVKDVKFSQLPGTWRVDAVCGCITWRVEAVSVPVPALRPWPLTS